MTEQQYGGNGPRSSFVQLKCCSGRLSAEQALHIARLDAAAAYGDLDDFRITIARQPNGWHIDYELLDAMRDGGGPHYVIDARSGKILAKRYEQ